MLPANDWHGTGARVEHVRPDGDERFLDPDWMLSGNLTPCAESLVLGRKSSLAARRS